MKEKFLLKTFVGISVLALWTGAALAQTTSEAQTPGPASAPQSSYSAQTRDTGKDMTNNTGVGLEIGTMTGPEVKWWATNSQAVQFGAGFNGPSSAIFADYLFHFTFQGAISSDLGSDFSPYIGVGAIAGWNGSDTFNHDIGTFGFGFRVPLGVEFIPQTAPFGIFAELEPGIGVSPSTFGFFQADLGGRYYF